MSDQDDYIDTICDINNNFVEKDTETTVISLVCNKLEILKNNHYLTNSNKLLFKLNNAKFTEWLLNAT